jgi:hypothetical protein
MVGGLWADPGEKSGPRKTLNAGAERKLEVLDLNTPNREDRLKIPIMCRPKVSDGLQDFRDTGRLLAQSCQ